MKTPKESFGGTDSPIDDINEGRSTGLERIVRQQIANQVEAALRNI